MTPTRCLALAFVFTTACISETERRRHGDEDSSTPPDTTDDTAPDTVSPDTSGETSNPDIADTIDDSLIADTADTADTLGHACLPTGCEAPGQACELASGWCFIDGACVPSGAARPDNTCRVCDPSAPLVYSPATFGTTCDDGIACTFDDLCVDGRCQGNATCPTVQFFCARNECNFETGACDEIVDEGRCLINGICYNLGQTDTGGCGRCVPDVDARAFVAGDGDEPTNSFLESVTLPEVSSSDVTGWSFPAHDASLSPAQDRDFYEFVYDTAVSFHRPVARITPRGGPHELDACMFIECLSLNATPLELTVGCEASANKVVENGKTGCCRVATANADLPMELTVFRAFCSDVDGPAPARAKAYVTVKRKVPPVEPGCLGYKVDRGVRLVTQ